MRPLLGWCRRGGGAKSHPGDRGRRIRKKEKHITIRLRGEGWAAGATVPGGWIEKKKKSRLLGHYPGRQSIFGGAREIFMTHAPLPPQSDLETST